MNVDAEKWIETLDNLCENFAIVLNHLSSGLSELEELKEEAEHHKCNESIKECSYDEQDNWDDAWFDDDDDEMLSDLTACQIRNAENEIYFANLAGKNRIDEAHRKLTDSFCNHNEERMNTTKAHIAYHCPICHTVLDFNPCIHQTCPGCEVELYQTKKPVLVEVNAPPPPPTSYYR